MKDKISEIKIDQKCIGGNLLHSFCINVACNSENNFVCNNDECQCNLKHQYCLKGKVKLVLKSITDKLNDKPSYNTDQLKSQITNIFTKLFNNMKGLQQHLIRQVDNNFFFHPLIDLEKRFLQIFVDQKVQNLKEFNGQNLQNLWKNIDKDNISNFQIQQQLKFQNYLQLIRQHQQQCLDINETTKKSLNQLLKLKKIKTQRISQISLSSLKSSIIKNDQQLKKIIKFFPQSLPRIKNINLIFKASENNFEISNFFKKCQNVSNIIILVLTHYDKIIGGFSPLQLNYQYINGKYQYQCYEVKDHSNSSFIFSLTNNHKFQLKSNNSAIIKYKSRKQIVFGRYQLKIYDKANSNTMSCTSLANINYQNLNYQADKQSYLKFNGGQSKVFAIKQWEAFHVKFD